MFVHQCSSLETRSLALIQEAGPKKLIQEAGPSFLELPALVVLHLNPGRIILREEEGREGGGNEGGGGEGIGKGWREGDISL